MSTSPITVPVRSLCCLVVSLNLAVAAVQAQDQRPAQTQQARLQGVVVLESTFEPIADAVVTVIGTDVEARTGSMGEFAITDAPNGTAWVRVTAPGMPSVREQVEISADGVVFLQFRMPDDVSAVLDEVMVGVWDRQQITNTEAESALDLVAARVPSIGMRIAGNVGDNDGEVRLRGFNTFQGDGNPLIVIDNVVAQGGPPLDLLSHIPASDVESIEVLRGPSAAFHYPFAANGVIAITTKK